MLACVWLPEADSALARRLFAVSPSVECDGACAFLDLRGLQRLHRHPAGLFAAIRAALLPHAARGMALAANPFTAEVAARFGRGPVTVRAGDEAAFLAHLPLTALPLAPALAQRLLPLGLRTLGDFASLPRASVERRYGAEGVALHRLACGQDRRLLLPQREPRALSVLESLPFPADRLAQLLPSLESALARLCGRVLEEGRGIARLALTLTLDHGPTAGATCDLSLPEAQADAVLLLDLLRGRIEAAPPGAPVTALHVQALQTAPLAVHQNGLFGEGTRDAARRAEALARLSALFGERAVARPRLVQAHRLEQRWHVAEEERGVPREQRTSQAARPCSGAPAGSADGHDVFAGHGAAARPAPSPALRILREPEELVPIVASGQVAGFRRGRQELRVARLTGPRRLCGGWWSQPWERDEYELLTAEGAQYRICRDARRRRWLLLAEFD